MASIVEYIINNVDPREYYKTIFSEIHWSPGNNEARVLSPFVPEKTPSFSVNGETGAWYSFCETDECGGKSIVSFHARLSDCSKKEAARKLFHTYIHPTIEDIKIEKWHRALLATPSILKYIKGRRVGMAVIKQLKLGWNGSRIIMPIKNEFGIYVNCKLHQASKSKKMPKMLNYAQKDEPRSYGSPTMLFPLEIISKTEGPIVICEGEWDALALLSLGVAAVTSSAGAKSWPKQYSPMFKGRVVAIAYDNDEAGKVNIKRVIKPLAKFASAIKQIKTPKKYGKDVNDFILNSPRMRKAKPWMDRIKRANPITENTEDVSDVDDLVQVPLDKSSQARYFNKMLSVDGLVTGKGCAPYLLPKKIRVSCEEECDGCRLVETGTSFLEHNVDVTSPDVLGMLDASKATVRKILLGMAGIDSKQSCRATVDIIATFNVEHLLVIPTLDSESSQYVLRTCYYVGHGLHANRAYRFKGKTLPSPKDQSATSLFSDATPVQGEVDNFDMTPEMGKKLERFQPGKMRLLAHLMSIANWQSHNITKIHERPDLHMAVDLIFHSVRSFQFNKEVVHRGMLDGLVIGDTRCGKGYVAERLRKYYGLGEVASGENCSFAGLVGGCEQVSGRWIIKWGVIPLNHNRLVIIDEASNISEKEIGSLSRVRSEGIAEINKIVSEATQANTRLVWLSNPRDGKPITQYNTGVESIKELIGANEDISRFDFAMTVAANEVRSDVINAIADTSLEEPEKYPKDLCRLLVLWAWSRQPNQIKFTDKATALIIKNAIEFGNKYSSSIPLIQSENIRIKIAKISAAIAARVFSTNSTYEQIIINGNHVRCACAFLDMIYSKPSMGYDVFSNTTKSASKLSNEDEIGSILGQLGPSKDAAITGLAELYKITPDSLSDFVGDSTIAKTLIGDLVRHRCLCRIDKGNWYVKNPEFGTWLRTKIRSNRKRK